MICKIYANVDYRIMFNITNNYCINGRCHHYTKLWTEGNYNLCRNSVFNPSNQNLSECRKDLSAALLISHQVFLLLLSNIQSSRNRLIYVYIAINFDIVAEISRKVEPLFANDESHVVLHAYHSYRMMTTRYWLPPE